MKKLLIVIILITVFTIQLGTAHAEDLYMESSKSEITPYVQIDLDWYEFMQVRPDINLMEMGYWLIKIYDPRYPSFPAQYQIAKRNPYTCVECIRLIMPLPVDFKPLDNYFKIEVHKTGLDTSTFTDLKFLFRAEVKDGKIISVNDKPWPKGNGEFDFAGEVSLFYSVRMSWLVEWDWKKIADAVFAGMDVRMTSESGLFDNSVVEAKTNQGKKFLVVSTIVDSVPRNQEGYVDIGKIEIKTPDKTFHTRSPFGHN